MPLGMLASSALKFGPYIPISSCCNGSLIHLKVTAEEWESLGYGHTPLRLALQVGPSCVWHMNKRQDDFNKRLGVWNQFEYPPNDPSRWGFLPDTDPENTNMGVPVWKKSHLLSLPKELRLEIWKWSLTDHSQPDLVVNIGRATKEAYGCSAKAALKPRVITWLEPGRNHSIGHGLLRTNRFIYEEALPLLYGSVRFALADHQGIFPLFLETLSPYARSLIRHIKLHVPRQIYDIDLFGDPAVPLFHWAVTCAQVAKLEGQLRDVEIEGLWTRTGSINEKTKCSILFPLCKIKTKKIFGPNNDDGMDGVLMHAKVDLEHKTALRRIEAAAKAAADAASMDSDEQSMTRVNGVTALNDLRKQRQQEVSDDEFHHRGMTSDATILRSLSTVAGIHAFEKELNEHTSPFTPEPSSADDARTLAEDWDLISYRSGASTPRGRPPSYMSRWSTDSWTDVVSTIADVQSLDKDDEMDSGSDCDYGGCAADKP